MLDCTADIENLTNEELLALVLSMVAPSEADPFHEHCLRFDAQRAATELYCRATATQRAEGTPAAASPHRAAMVAKTLRRV
jgi:hypothetical protein